MDKFKKLMVLGWELGKFFFSKDFKTPEEYSQFVDFGNDLLKKTVTEYGEFSKETRLVKRLIVAVNEYCDQDWRDTHTGEQMTLFGED